MGPCEEKVRYKEKYEEEPISTYVIRADIPPMLISAYAQCGGSVIVDLNLRSCNFLWFGRFFGLLLFLLLLRVRLGLGFCAFCRKVVFGLALVWICVLGFGVALTGIDLGRTFHLYWGSLHGGGRDERCIEM